MKLRATIWLAIVLATVLSLGVAFSAAISDDGKSVKTQEDGGGKPGGSSGACLAAFSLGALLTGAQ